MRFLANFFKLQEKHFLGAVNGLTVVSDLRLTGKRLKFMITMKVIETK